MVYPMVLADILWIWSCASLPIPRACSTIKFAAILGFSSTHIPRVPVWYGGFHVCRVLYRHWNYSDQELQRAKQFRCSLHYSNVKYRFGTSRSPLTKTLSPYVVSLGRSRFPDNFPLDRSLEVEYVLNANPGIKIDNVPLTHTIPLFDYKS